MGLKSKIGMFLILGLLAACSEIIEVPEINEQEITVLAPLEGVVITGNDVSFNWNALADARGYKVEVAQPNFATATQIVLDSTFVEDSLRIIGTKIQRTLLNGNYQWRIKGLNGGLETPFTTNSFTVDGDANIDLTPPNTPTLLAPVNDATLDETSVSFSWSREDISGSAERDSIYIYTDEALQTLELKGLGANKIFDTTLNANTYYWLVQAFDAGGNKSADSAVFTLNIN